MKVFYPGDRVMVFDHLLHKDDVSTPLSHTVRPATVVRWYGKTVRYPGNEEDCIYPSLIDVRFDHRGLSNGHFTDHVKKI
jgi:hypothetical protein